MAAYCSKKGKTTMRYAVTSSEMKQYDRNTSQIFGVQTEILMERASLSVCDEVDRYADERKITRKRRALVFAGIGNNGGDGACIARLLKQRGYLVNLCVIGDPTKCSDLLLMQLKICGSYGITTDTFSNIRDNKSVAEWDIIVDALFGIGLSRNVTGTFEEAINYINDCKKERLDDMFVVSVDIPSGINADNGKVMGCAVMADSTVTFNQVKIGHLLYPGCEYTGKLIVKDAGITDESFLTKEPTCFWYDDEVKDLLPERKKDSNKGTNGKVLVIAGSKTISGACILSASACLKSGAGMVMVFTAAENADAVKTLLPEALLCTYEDFEPILPKLSEAMKWSSCAVIGPGIGVDGKGIELVRTLFDNYDKDIIADADALNIISDDKSLRSIVSNYATGGKKLIITPHLGEFARLFNTSVADCKEHLLEYPKELANELHCTVICKDARSIVSDSNEKKIYINMSGNDGMATAGSGDVLTGILGALLSYDLTGFEAACLGAYIHGAAGNIAARGHGKLSMTATDIVDELEDILK